MMLPCTNGSTGSGLTFSSVQLTTQPRVDSAISRTVRFIPARLEIFLRGRYRRDGPNSTSDTSANHAVPVTMAE